MNFKAGLPTDAVAPHCPRVWVYVLYTCSRHSLHIVNIFNVVAHVVRV